MPFVYMLRCSDGTLYTGWTTDPAKRLEAHSRGTGSRYTRSRRPLEMVYLEVCETRELAMSREWHLKRLSRSEKEKLVSACPKTGIPVFQDKEEKS